MYVHHVQPDNRGSAVSWTGPAAQERLGGCCSTPDAAVEAAVVGCPVEGDSPGLASNVWLYMVDIHDTRCDGLWLSGSGRGGLWRSVA